MPDFPDRAEVAVEAKLDLRTAVLARRRALPADRRITAAGRVQDELIKLVRRLRPARATGYVPVGTEPGGADLPDVLLAALGSSGQLLLPVLCPDLDLDWARYPGPDGLVAAGRGLREPAGERLGRAAIGRRGTGGGARTRGRPARQPTGSRAAARTTGRCTGGAPTRWPWRCCTTASWSTPFRPRHMTGRWMR